jgi:acetyl-CoA carboxylase biotin carboxyl carrier protein
MDIKRVENFFELIKDTDIKELCWERSGLKLRIKRSGTHVDNEQIESSLTTENVENTTEDMGKEHIRSKFVGSFFTVAKGKRADIKIGDRINKGQILGYIEAMNIFKEVISDFEGVISDILVRDGSAIEYGQKLFVVEIK